MLDSNFSSKKAANVTCLKKITSSNELTLPPALLTNLNMYKWSKDCFHLEKVPVPSKDLVLPQELRCLDAQVRDMWRFSLSLWSLFHALSMQHTAMKVERSFVNGPPLEYFFSSKADSDGRKVGLAVQTLLEKKVNPNTPPSPRSRSERAVALAGYSSYAEAFATGAVGRSTTPAKTSPQPSEVFPEELSNPQTLTALNKPSISAPVKTPTHKSTQHKTTAQLTKVASSTSAPQPTNAFEFPSASRNNSPLVHSPTTASTQSTPNMNSPRSPSPMQGSHQDRHQVSVGLLPEEYEAGDLRSEDDEPMEEKSDQGRFLCVM